MGRELVRDNKKIEEEKLFQELKVDYPGYTHLLPGYSLIKQCKVISKYNLPLESRMGYYTGAVIGELIRDSINAGAAYLAYLWVDFVFKI